MAVWQADLSAPLLGSHNICFQAALELHSECCKLGVWPPGGDHFQGHCCTLLLGLIACGSLICCLVVSFLMGVLPDISTWLLQKRCVPPGHCHGK